MSLLLLPSDPRVRGHALSSTLTCLLCREVKCFLARDRFGNRVTQQCHSHRALIQIFPRGAVQLSGGAPHCSGTALQEERGETGRE